MEFLNLLSEILKFIFFALLGIFAGLIIVLWLHTTIMIDKKVEENNYLLKELCIQQGLNPDSVINQMKNDTIQ